MDKTIEKIYKWNYKKWIIAVGIVLAISSLIIGTYMMHLETFAQDSSQPSSDAEIEQLLTDDADVTAVVYTYSGETYEISGKIAKYLSQPESADPVMELNGTMENKGAQEMQHQVERQFPESDPFSMTVYTPAGEIYGFQTYHQVKLDKNQEQNKIELYGYLVGYYDGENYY